MPRGKCLTEKDSKLLRAFIETDTQDYAKHNGEKSGLNAAGEKYVEFIMKKIMSQIKKINKKFESIIIESHGNMGCVTRQLKLDTTGQWWKLGKADIQVSLCTCGEKKHWGRVTWTPRPV